MSIYLPNIREFEHEPTETELNFKANMFVSGFLFLVGGILLVGIGKIIKKTNKER